MSAGVRVGQVYEACHPLDGGRQIVVYEVRDGRAWVETVGDQARGRWINASLLHAEATTGTGQPRRTGYRLVQDAPGGAR